MTIKATANDEVVFTSLKPMELLNLSVPVLIYDKFMRPDMGIFFDSKTMIVNGGKVDINNYIGWQHVPMFKPEWA